MTGHANVLESATDERRTQQLRLLVFGSTGRVGRHVVEQALERGHVVTAFAREPAALDISHDRLMTVQGDVTDFAQVMSAMHGHQAVLAALGSPAWRNTAVRSIGNRHIARAMEAAGIRRLVSLSTLGAGDSWQILPLKYKILFRTLLRDAFAAHEAQETCIAHTELDWTIVRPGAFTSGDRTRTYRHGFAPTDRTIKAELSPADVADFMLEQLSDDTYLRQAPSVSY